MTTSKELPIDVFSLITLSSQMLFPPQVEASDQVKRTVHRINDEKSKKRDNARLAAEVNISAMRFAYETDCRNEYLHQLIPALLESEDDIVPDAKSIGTRSIPKSGLLRIEPRKINRDVPLHYLPTAKVVLRFLRPAPAGVQDQAKLESVNGQIAGSLLWYMYHMKHCGFSKPGFRVARQIFIDHYPLRRFLYDPNCLDISDPSRLTKQEVLGLPKFNDSKLNTVWNTFRPVAHFWAALLAMNADIIDPTNRPLPTIKIARRRTRRIRSVRRDRRRSC